MATAQTKKKETAHRYFIVASYPLQPGYLIYFMTMTHYGMIRDYLEVFHGALVILEVNVPMGKSMFRKCIVFSFRKIYGPKLSRNTRWHLGADYLMHGGAMVFLCDQTCFFRLPTYTYNFFQNPSKANNFFSQWSITKQFFSPFILFD